MKKYVFCLVLMVILSVCGDFQRARAYTVTVEEDGMYEEIVPSSIMKNVTAMFKKQVRKSMEYYDKYKDAGAYTYAREIPSQYLDFIEVAKELQDSDEIVICHPFYIYHVATEEGWYQYYFVAERNHEKLCIFSIYVDLEQDGKTQFYYDNMMDRYFSMDGYIADQTLFYEAGNMVYAETPEKVEVVRELPMRGTSMGDESAKEEREKEFCKLNYEEKKKEIFDYLDKIKTGKAIKKADENIKLDLKDEYSEPEKDAKENGRTGNFMKIGIYIVAGVGILVIGVIAGENIIMKKRKKV